MLSHADNEYLCRVGPGTPMGALLRRFWMPALVAKELPSPDCPPVRLTLLSEKLVAFRDSTGRVSVVAENCPHRGASLFFGRNEEEGLRCVYHGWKFDYTGACVDMPNEPPESNFKHKVKVTAYPAEEAGDVIWIYMGPTDLKPELPRPEWTLVPPEQRKVTRYIQENNWVQGVEGGIDSSHVSFLHSMVESHKGTFADDRARLMTADTAPEFRVVNTDFGLLIGARRRISENESYWRVTPYSLPFYTVIPGVPNRDSWYAGHGWVPIDDEHLSMVTYSWHPTRPLSDFGERHGHQAHYVRKGPDDLHPIQSRENDYMIDRVAQKTTSYTGIENGSIQDRGIQETMGRIYDRTKEHLGSADTAIIMMRRLLMRLARELEEGKEPWAASHPEVSTVRSAGFLADSDRSFVEVSEPLVRVGR
ncbi:MAG TPA: Rieske 2Fe-2S domain-containing protein [Chloroflexota bacterium]|jgi:phthalate 4,5-dioxygenase|nr:Rieske 2Fe-2S domain-containing protein [Chloroflexota bacterium]